MQLQKLIVFLFVAGLLIKGVLFFYLCLHHSPALICIDSRGYLVDAQAWVDFFHTPSAGLHHSFFRTPGYTFFLSIVHGELGLSLWVVIFLQVLFTILTALIVYQIFRKSSMPQAALLGATIVILDLPTTIYSLMILTESLYLLMSAFFIYTFMAYIKARNLKWLLLSAVFLAICTYIRPVGYFFSFPMALFILFLWGKEDIRRGINHALIFLLIIHGSCFFWEYYNMTRPPFGVFAMSNIEQATVFSTGFLGSYATQGHHGHLPSFFYDVEVSIRHFLTLMTNPGSIRQLNLTNLSVLGIVFGYILVVFWWVGIIVGVIKEKKDLTYLFLALYLLYYLIGTIAGVGNAVSPRYRIPMLPALAIFSARGWFLI